MRKWVGYHWRAWVLTLKRLLATPFSTLLNVSVIGIAVSLPAGAYVVLANLHAVSEHITSTPQMSAFMAVTASKEDLKIVRANLERHPEIQEYVFMPKDEALEKLSASTGLTDVVQELGENPLPDAFVIRPKTSEPTILEHLKTEISRWPGIEFVQLDSAWAQRLDAFLRLGRLAVLILGALLGLGLVVVSFNTVRLQILTRYEEIEISKLTGATNSFIRRPFLYYGAIQGMAGGVIAWAIVVLAAHILNPSIAEVARLYGSLFRIEHLSLPDTLSLIGFSALLGWLGAWASVAKHLWQIEPR